MNAVVLDTDIGSDIDDTWALGLLLRCPELDLRLVTTVSGDTTYRARIAAGILSVAGRDNVPIGIGISTPWSGAPAQPQSRFADEVALDRYRGDVRADGVAALVECVMSSDEPITVISIGQMTNIAAALALEPSIAHRARFVAMAGSLRKGYFVPGGDSGELLAGDPIPEANVVNDVPACRAAFTAGWSTTITPLDTCGSIIIRDERYRKIRTATGSLIKAVLRNYQEWAEVCFPCADDRGTRSPFWQRRSSTLYDTVAVYLAYDESFVNIEQLPIAVDDTGLMSVSSDGARLRVATSWRDQGLFEDHLVERLTS